MFKNKLIPCALLTLSHSLVAAQAPTSGSQLQQIPPAPVQQKAIPRVDVQPSAPVPAPVSDTSTVRVNTLSVTGAQAFSQEQLLAVTGFTQGKQVSLADLRAMALKIADFYHANGYFVTQAYLPAQDIKDGAVTIAVLEGRYGQVVLHNQSNLSDRVPNSLLGGLNKDDVIAVAPLENRLLLLSDLPGVQVKSTLAPGAAVGTSDLIVDITPGQRISGSVDADNAGNRYTGVYRVGATVNLNEPAGLGDVASLRVLSAGSGLNYARASYQLQLGKAKAGVAYSHLRYKVGREFASLGANGWASVASIYGNYPLIRSRASNLNVQLAYDAKKFQDKVDSTASVTDKNAHVVTASLYGDHHDRIGGGAQNAFSLSLSSGKLDIETPFARLVDSVSAQTNGSYNKLAFSAMRVQRVTDRVALSAAVAGQRASKNLDASERMELGGMYAVRAYPEGEAYGDEGYVVNLEARLQLPVAPESGQLQAIAFVDGGHVTINKNPWTPGENSRSLRGAGIGLNWNGPNNFNVKAYYAHKIGGAAATSAPDKSGRFWIQAVKYF